MTTLPAITQVVARESWGSYRSAVGISSCITSGIMCGGGMCVGGSGGAACGSWARDVGGVIAWVPVGERRAAAAAGRALQRSAPAHPVPQSQDPRTSQASPLAKPAN